MKLNVQNFQRIAPPCEIMASMFEYWKLTSTERNSGASKGTIDCDSAGLGMDWGCLGCVRMLMQSYACFIMFHHVSSFFQCSRRIVPYCTNTLHIPAARLGTWWPQDGTGRKIRSFSQALAFSDKNNTPIPPTKVRPGVNLHWVCHSLPWLAWFPFFSPFLKSFGFTEIYRNLTLARLRCIIHSIPCIAISYHIDTWKCRQIALKIEKTCRANGWITWQNARSLPCARNRR